MEIKELVFKKLSTKTKKKFAMESVIEELGIDSLDLVELVTDAEDETGLRIADEDLEKIKTVGDVVKAFENAKK